MSDALSPALARWIPPAPASGDAVLEAFLGHVAETGISLYPAQEEAILELLEGKHVILDTPTGSGKSLVALALQFAAVARGQVCVYTSPIKALVNEKFFWLCRLLGADRVGMLTGDASIHRDAPVLCCTAEVLASWSLDPQARDRIASVVMDEFHYYGDKDRGRAWQIPLIQLPRTQFLLMSGTLGNTEKIEEHLHRRTGRPVAVVRHGERPVPLEFSYRQTPLHETIAELIEQGRAPLYLVHFSHADASESAQALTSIPLCTKDERDKLREALASERFPSPYGKELQRFLRHGIGVHHAGLLPRYRRLVERLAQANLLKIICGTDTLGVGINVPIRSVLFTQLCKFDGEKTIILPARDFQQIAGRAGRKGFDDRGWVLAQAPAHVIENIDLKRKRDAGKKVQLRSAPEFGYAHWEESTFERLRTQLPEALHSRFFVDHGLVLQLLLDADVRDSDHHRGGGYRAVLDLIEHAHIEPGRQAYYKREAARVVRQFRQAGLVLVEPRYDAWPRRRAGSRLSVSPKLPRDFSLPSTLGLWLLEAMPLLQRDSDTYALDVLSLVEATLENPMAILRKQVDRAKTAKMAELKANGVEYDERIAELEKVTYPQPLSDFVHGTYEQFSHNRPWIRGSEVQPKSIARDLLEQGASFVDYVRDYRLERAEGVLLRYIGDTYRALTRQVPPEFVDDTLADLIAALEVTVRTVDASLLEEWEQLRNPEAWMQQRLTDTPAPVVLRRREPTPREIAARARAEVHQFLRSVALRKWDDASGFVWDPEHQWTPDVLESSWEPFFAEHGGVDMTPRGRQSQWTLVDRLDDGAWRIRHRVLAADGDDLWVVEGRIDPDRPAPDAPWLEVRYIGT